MTHRLLSGVLISLPLTLDGDILKVYCICRNKTKFSILCLLSAHIWRHVSRYSPVVIMGELQDAVLNVLQGFIFPSCCRVHWFLFKIMLCAKCSLTETTNSYLRRELHQEDLLGQWSLFCASRCYDVNYCRCFVYNVFVRLYFNGNVNIFSTNESKTKQRTTFVILC